VAGSLFNLINIEEKYEEKFSYIGSVFEFGHDFDWVFAQKRREEGSAGGGRSGGIGRDSERGGGKDGI
jgi:hypothetical protein